jgi:hypothetical protein
MEDIRLFLITLRIMVLACTESKLDSDRDKTEMFSVKGYTVIRTDRETDKGGGTIIYINDELSYEELDTDFSDTPPLTELHVVKVWKTGLKPIIISSIYNHPKTYPSRFNIFLQLHVFLSQYDGEKIIFGDFNMDLMKHKNTFDVNTHKYLLLNNEFGFKQVISGPTHRGISLLDHLHLNHPEKYGGTGHFQLSSSDHELVFCIRKQTKNKIPAKTVLCRNYKNVDWSSINEEILKFDFNNIDAATSHRPSSIDNAFSEFNLNIMSLLDKFAPTKKKIIKDRFSPWLTTTVLESLKLRNKAHRIATKSVSEDDWKHYRRLRNDTNQKLSQSKKNYFRVKFSEHRDTTNLWNTVDELIKFRSKVRYPVSSLQVNGEIITDEEKLVEGFANEFTMQMEDTVSSDDMNSAVHSYVTNFKNSVVDNIYETDFVANSELISSEIEKCIKSMKNKKGGCNLYPSMFHVKTA